MILDWNFVLKNSEPAPFLKGAWGRSLQRKKTIPEPPPTKMTPRTLAVLAAAHFGSIMRNPAISLDYTRNVY